MNAKLPDDLDALRDARALWVAKRDGDEQARRVLKAHATDPWMTAECLAELLVAVLEAVGGTITPVDEWFRWAGLAAVPPGEGRQSGGTGLASSQSLVSSGRETCRQSPSTVSSRIAWWQMRQSAVTGKCRASRISAAV